MTPLLHFHVMSRLVPRGVQDLKKMFPNITRGMKARVPGGHHSCCALRRHKPAPWPHCELQNLTSAEDTLRVVTLAQAGGYFIHLYPFVHVPRYSRQCCHELLGCLYLFESYSSLDICPGVGLLDHMVALFTGFKGCSTTFSG